MTEPYKKVFAFEKMTVIHPSGEVQHFTLDTLRFQKQVIKDDIKRLQIELANMNNDIAKVTERNPIKRFFKRRQLQ